MPELSWEPDGDLERDLSACRQRRDDEAFLRRLARADLLLPLLPDRAGPAWLTSLISGERCVVAFTSVPAMRRLMGGEPAYRSARFIELAATWPDPSVQLAVDPGLPIEVFLSPAVVVELAGVAALPATELEAALARALEDGDPEAYAKVLLATDVLVPIEPGSESRDITDPAFGWVRMEGEETPIAVFTSPERLREQLGDPELVEVAFGELVTAWPDPASGLAVDPGTAYGGVLAAEAVTGLGAELDRRGRIAAEIVREAGTRIDLTEPQRVHLAQRLLDERLDERPAEDDRSNVQVVILAVQVERYLRQGHRRVAGLIHRRPAQPMPLADLYHWLGLIGEGSPFTAADPLGHVLRWVEADPAAFAAPTMDGVEVPEGASLWQIDGAGGEQRLATLRDGRWVAGP